MTLEPGIERTEEFTAEGRLLTDVRGTLPVKVLSTPGMIAMMERCATHPQLGATSTTARPRWASRSASSTWPLPRGRRLHGHSEAARGRGRRKLRFDVEVRDGERTIGVGTHERRVIDRSNFGG